MGKVISNFWAILLLVLLVSSGIMEKGEAEGREWECKGLGNFKCWLGQVGHKLCDDFCKSEKANSGVCVPATATTPSRCLCRKTEDS